MTREQLQELGYTDEQVNELVDLHGKGIEKIKRERDEVKEQLVDVQGELNEREAKVQELTDSVGNAEELQTKLGEITNDYEKYKEDAEKREKDYKFNSALDLHLVQSGTVDTTSLKPHIDLSTLELQEDGTLKGFNEQVEVLKENKKFLFGESLNSSLEHGKPIPKEPSLRDTLYGKDK